MLLISLLGERTAIDTETNEVRTRSSRTIALIAFLALHVGLPQPRARIAAAFWPDSPEQQALTNLRRELHQLRRVLDDDQSLTVTATDLTWRDRPTCVIDLLTFCRAREKALAAAPTQPELVLEHGVAALSAYGGELLPGLYDEWLLPERALLAEQAGELCRLVSDAGRLTGRWQVAIGAARRRIALDPLDEAGYQDLIRLQTASGDRAGALSTFHHCASVLESELGLEPDPATRHLVDGLLDSTTGPDRARERAPGPSATASSLVGRGRRAAPADRGARRRRAGRRARLSGHRPPGCRQDPAGERARTGGATQDCGRVHRPLLRRTRSPRPGTRGRVVGRARPQPRPDLPPAGLARRAGPAPARATRSPDRAAPTRRRGLLAAAPLLPGARARAPRDSPAPRPRAGEPAVVRRGDARPGDVPARQRARATAPGAAHRPGPRAPRQPQPCRVGAPDPRLGAAR